METPFRTDNIVIDLKKDGNRLSGTITRSDPPGQQPMKLEGEINNDKMEFKVNSPDGKRIITVSGNVTEDEITFMREVSGTAGRGPGLGFYGLNGPDFVTAIRLK